jgi:hypothetical protein
MKTPIRVLSLIVAAAVFLTRAAGAQSVAIYGGAEAAGLGEHNAILGASLSSGLLGWHPIVGANVQQYTYRSGTAKVSKWAFVPSAGLQYRTHEGAVQGTVGYAFVTGGDAPTQLGIGSTTGSSSGLVLGLQGNYWANNQEHQAIVSYNTRAEYLWSRARLAHRINAGSPRSVPIYLGGEVVYQGGRIKSLGTSQHRIQFGPTINFHFTPDFHLGGSAGYRTDDQQHIGTGYVRVEFVKLLSL